MSASGPSLANRPELPPDLTPSPLPLLLQITDCAKYLNGRGIGSRFDGSYPGSTKRGDCPYYTGNGDNFTQEYKTYLRQVSLNAATPMMKLHKI